MPEYQRERANPDADDYQKAVEIVRLWLSEVLHASVSAQIPGDDAGQLADMIAWALTAKGNK
jgi:hypothetical protein